MATGPIKTDANGRPLMLRDSRTATVNFKLRNTWWDGVPKPKFLFYLRFFRADGAAPTQSASNQSLDWSKSVGLMVKSVNMPNVDFDTETLNQYNKKRVIQKRVEYGPMAIRFHDTVDSKAYIMFEEYFRFYYGDARAANDSEWTWDINAPELRKPSKGFWGFNPPDVEPNFAYFFSRIEVYTLYGGRYSRFDLVNPKITSFDPDELDFSEGQIGREVTMNLDYEGIVYKGHLLPLSGANGLIEEMNLDKSNFYEPADAANQRSGANIPVVGPTQQSQSNVDPRVLTNLIGGSSTDALRSQIAQSPVLGNAGSNMGVVGNPLTEMLSGNTGKTIVNDVLNGRGLNPGNILTNVFKR